MNEFETQKIESLMERIADRNVAEAIEGKRILEVNSGKCQIVKASEFEAEVKRAGLTYPKDYISAKEFMKPIADRVLPKYNKIIRKRYGK